MVVSPMPPLIILLILAGGFAMQTRLVHRRLGHSPYRFGGGDDAAAFLGRSFRLVTVALYAFFAARAIWPGIEQQAGPLPWLRSDGMAAAGTALMAAATALVLTAQAQMRTHWRIGLDTERVTSTLVTAGLFAVSRNPVFLGMMMLLVAAVLVAPTAVTLALAVAGWLTISTQIRLEEDYLAAHVGADYDAYRRRVRRWLGRITRDS